MGLLFRGAIWVSPFIVAHHVVAAVESEDGEISTGFCIESASGVMNLCTERVATLNMYMRTRKMMAYLLSHRFSKIKVFKKNYTLYLTKSSKQLCFVHYHL